jgi:aminopeptidase N
MPLSESPYASLQHTEARHRRDLLDVTSYDVDLDLTTSDETFRSVTTIVFESRGGYTFVDLKAVQVAGLRLNGSTLDPALVARGRVEIDTVEGTNELVADATMHFRNDGEGLHRSVDPADGRHYVYGMCFMDAAPSIFACFDQPDLKAPFTLHVTAPAEWVVIGNAPGKQVDTGRWEFEQTPPLSTYFVTLVAGPYHVLTDAHDGIPLGLSSRASIAKDLDADADELFTMTKQCFDEFHRLFGIRYPFGNYHQAFVPEFNAGAMENPGCVTFRDPYVFSSRATRGDRIRRATTVAHEMAHQWFGNLVTPRWWDDLWLNESFAEYMGNRVTADATQFGDAWTHNAYARRQWGLTADLSPSTHPVAGNGATDSGTALENFDGISYTKGSAILKQLNARVGDEVFFGGVIRHFELNRFGNATMDDLFASWEQAGAGDLSAFTSAWLRTAGVDTLSFIRHEGVVRRDAPKAHPADREHTFRALIAAPGQPWRSEHITVSTATPLTIGGGEAVVLDPFEDTWAQVPPDAETAAALVELLPTTDDERLRSGIWNGLRSAFHNALLDPELAISLVEAAVPVEDNDDALAHTLTWAIKRVSPLTADPIDSLRRVHAACLARLVSVTPGSTAQLAAFQNAIGSSTSADELRGWLAADGLPEHLQMDLELRWRILVHLASMSQITREELAGALAAEPTAISRVEHARAMASLPDEEAKAWAWSRFLGEVDVPNYELKATGLGMWRHGQGFVTDAYVDRFFEDLPGTLALRSGWLVADAAEHFFPHTSLSEETVARALAFAADPNIEAVLRRPVADAADILARNLAVRRTFGR